MATIKYDAILTAALGGSEGAVAATKGNDAVQDLFRMAWELDALKVRLIDGANDMARRFTRYAEETELAGPNGSRVYEPPTGWSTLRDMEKDATKYDTLRDVFHNSFRTVTGKRLREVVESVQVSGRLTEAGRRLVP